MADFSFKEVNFQEFKTGKEESNYLDICIYNYYHNNIPRLIESIQETLKNFNYRITVLELKEQEHNTDISKFISQYPKIKLFLPTNKIPVVDCINLYIKESKANYILMLSGENTSLDIDLKKIDKMFLADPSLMALTPDIKINEKSIESIYNLKSFHRNLFLRYEWFQPNRLTIKPFKMNLFFDRAKFLGVGGLDPHWDSFFLSNLDFGYCSFAKGHQIKTSDGFNIHTQENQDVYLKDYTKIYSNLNMALKCFQIKNSNNIAPWCKVFSTLVLGLRSFNLRWLPKLFAWLSYRKNIKDHLLTETQISSKFN